MATSEEIKLIISTEVNKALKELKKYNDELDDVDDKNKKAEKSNSRLSSSFIAGAVSVAAMTAGIIKSVKAASDLEEATNKFVVVFRDVQDEAYAMADVLQDSYGMSERAALDMLSATGDVLTGFGFTQDAALELSSQIAVLGTDLASFTNYSGGAEGASEAVTKALLGETEQLKTLGIVVNDTTMKQMAAAEGIELVNGQLTASDKAYLALKATIQQSANAQGDFQRSSESIANVMRTFTGDLEDLAANVGQELVPGMKSLILSFSAATSEGGALTAMLKGVAKVLNVVIKSVAIAIDGFNMLAGDEILRQQELMSISLRDQGREAITAAKAAEAAYGKQSWQYAQAKIEVDRIAVAQQNLTSATSKTAESLSQSGDNVARSLEEMGLYTPTQAEIEKRQKKLNNQLDITKQILDGNIDRTKLLTTEKQNEMTASQQAAVAEKEKIEQIKSASKEYHNYLQQTREERLTQEQMDFEFAIANIEQMNMTKEQLEQAHQDRIYEIKKAEMEKETALQRATSQFFVNTLGLNANAYQDFSSFMINNLDKSSKKQFKVWKAFSIIQAIGDTYRAANSAYAAMAGIPFIGPALGAAAASAAVAVSLQRVNKIKSMSPPAAEDGALISGSSSGQMILAGEKNKNEMIVPFENEEVMSKFRDAIGGGGGAGPSVNIQQFYSFGSSDESATAIDRMLTKLYKDGNSLFATEILK